MRRAFSRVFGRLIEFDRRSREFPIRALFGPGAQRRSYTWDCPVWLDQGREGACVGFSISHEAAADPVPVAGVTNATARALYKRAQQLDDMPGEDYEGTSVLAGMKAGVEKGWYEEYRWAFGEDDLAVAIGAKGPAVLGIEWREGMLTPDAAGRIRPTGRVVGGHAILCRGYSAKNGMYRLRNSWGRKWGVDGDCFVSAADVRLLLSSRGEACIPLKRLMGQSGTQERGKGRRRAGHRS